MADIFISYRRRDAGGYARTLHQELVARFGKRRVFMDVTGTEGGADFTEVITAELARARVQLVLIGAHWLAADNQNGRPRLFNSEDLVRHEIQRALARGMKVVPVLVRGAEIPSVSALPPELQPLAKLNAVVLSEVNWESDLEYLVALLKGFLQDPFSVHASARTRVGRLASVFLYRSIAGAIWLAGIAVYFLIYVVLILGLLWGDLLSKPNHELLFAVFGIGWGALTAVPYITWIGGWNTAGVVRLSSVVCSWMLAWVVFGPPLWVQTRELERVAQRGMPPVWGIFLLGVCGASGGAIASFEYLKHNPRLRREVLLVCMVWGLALAGSLCSMDRKPGAMASLIGSPLCSPQRQEDLSSRPS
jgi:TIR domain